MTKTKLYLPHVWDNSDGYIGGEHYQWIRSMAEPGIL